MSGSNSRRRFVLRSIAGTLALPGLASFASESAGNHSSVTARPGNASGTRRFVAIGNLLGFQRQALFPETEGKDFELTELLEPLADSRDQVTIYRGLDHGVNGGHFAVHSFLSGLLHHESKNRPEANVTVDQLIADEVGRHTRFPSLTVGSEGGIHGGCQLSWTKSGVRVPPITGPSELFARLFVNESADRIQQMKSANRLHSSILDAVHEEASELNKRVNREDQAKLDEYFSSIRDVEKRLQARKRWGGQRKPDAPFDQPADTNTVDDLPMLYELIALALQTDSTRVATLEIGGSFLPQHLGIDKSYHGMSHHGNDEQTIANLITLEKYQIQQFAGFIERLGATTDGEGTLLDSTAVLFGSGMGDGNSHKNTDLPIVMAGGGYGKGDYRKLPGKGPGKIPLCNLLLDIAQRMGVERSQFGTSTGTFS